MRNFAHEMLPAIAKHTCSHIAAPLHWWRHGEETQRPPPFLHLIINMFLYFFVFLVSYIFAYTSATLTTHPT